MPEVNAPQQQPPMEMEPVPISDVVSQQPEAQPSMDSTMSLRGGCGETIGCCGMEESCFCC